MVFGILAGIGSAIIGGLSSIGGAIASTLAPVGKALVPFATKVGKAITSFGGSTIRKIAEFLPKLPGPIIDKPRIPSLDDILHAVDKVGNIAHKVGNMLGFGKEEDDSLVLGAKAEKAEKDMESFDNDVLAYIKYLNDKIEITQKELEELKADKDKQLAAEAVGTSLNVKGVEQDMEVNIPPEFLGVVGKAAVSGKIAMTPEIVLGMLKSAKDAGIVDMKDIVEYLQGTGKSDRIATGKALREGLKNTVNDPDEFLDELKGVVRE